MSSSPRAIQCLAAIERGQLRVEPFVYTSRALGDDDVEIAISHCGICGTDVHAITDAWGHTTFPLVPGHELVGIVTAMGTNVGVGAHARRLAIGDRVGVGPMVFSCQDRTACDACGDGLEPFCPRGVPTYGGTYADGTRSQGGYAQCIRVHASYAFAIPASLSSAEAAPLLCAGVSVFAPLREHKVGPGQRVGVVGIGGLGHVALQFVRAMGATPVAISHSPDKQADALAWGAEQFIVLQDTAQLAAAARTLDLLVVTSDALAQPFDTYLGLVKRRGTLVMLGIPNDQIQLWPLTLLGSKVSIVGSAIGGIQDTVEMLAFAAAHGIRPMVQVLPMDNANQGLELVAQGKARYRVVLENVTDADKRQD